MENKQETLEEAAENYCSNNHAINEDRAAWQDIEFAFKDGAKWQQNDCVQFINKLEDESFDGWSEEAISGYLTACMAIKQKYIDTLNGN